MWAMKELLPFFHSPHARNSGLVPRRDSTAGEAYRWAIGKKALLERASGGEGTAISSLLYRVYGKGVSVPSIVQRLRQRAINASRRVNVSQICMNLSHASG